MPDAPGEGTPPERGAPSRIVDVTTVSDTAVIVHATRPDGSVDVVRHTDLLPASTIELTLPDRSTRSVRTLGRPPGELLAVVATVNDVHFGEIAAGQVDDLTDGPIRRSAPGAEPYPELMNRAAAAEIVAIDPDAVIVKGDLSVDGLDEEWAAFEACYRMPFGERLHVVRGNHDAYHHQSAYVGHQRIDVPGLTVALLDTVIPGATTGRVDDDAIAWLDDVASDADRPVMAMGHHQQWIGDPARRSDDYFGLHPDGSDRLDETIERRTEIIAYSAGHTHRHRVRRMRRSGVASIEVGCVKDFPGTWAEHRVYEGGVMHLVHRVSDPEALRWSESCRNLYSDFGVDYEQYALGSLDDRCFLIPFRN
ncbi:MAG: metallophosphoesterase [Actinomycetota bacterium]